jgi:hypothetical protein
VRHARTGSWENGSAAIASFHFSHPSFSLLRPFVVIRPVNGDAAAITIGGRSPPTQCIGRDAWRARSSGARSIRATGSNCASAERNRHRQQQRDERRRQGLLANISSASNLANNIPAIPEVIESKVPSPSCQQQPSGQWVVSCPIKGSEPCSPPIKINDLHHLHWAEHWPIRKIEQHLSMSWRTIKKYLEAPAQTPAARSRVSKLDPFKPTIAELLEKDARASAAVIEQRLRPLG